MKKKTNTTIWISVIGLLILLLLLKIGFSKPAEKDRRNSKGKSLQKVDAYIVKPTLLINELSVSGSLLAFEEVELKNEIAGRIVSINLPEGKFVKKGTLLVKLFNDDLQAGLKKLQAQLALQQQIYKRQTELIKVSGISQNDYDQTGLLVNSIKADIDQQKALIRKTEILAPFDGVIGLRNVSEGAVVSSSTLLATIRKESQLKLDFFIPEKYGHQIKTGMKVKFTMYNNGNTYNATVLATEQSIDDATRNLKVRAVVNNNPDNLLPGAFTNVVLRLGENKQALMIPNQAIIPEQQNKSVIVARNGKAHFVLIKTGIRKTSNIEIIDGLQPGDTIITTGLLFLKEDSKLLYSKVTDSL